MKFGADVESEEAVRELLEDCEGSPPRFGLFLFGCSDAAQLDALLKRIPKSGAAWCSGISVMLETASQLDRGPELPVSPFPKAALRFHRSPRAHGEGGLRKAAFEYAREAGFDHVLTLDARRAHPPELLPALVRAALAAPRDLVILDAPRSASDWLPPGLWRSLGVFLNRRALGLPLRGFWSSYRAYPTAALERIPYQLNSDDATFEVEMVIQCRSLGMRVTEQPLLSSMHASQGQPTLGGCAASIAYRLHQLHLIQDGRFLVRRDVKYTLKLSPTGSHMQIVDAIRPGSRVLDLGCSQGLLARPLKEKGVSVVGVDIEPSGARAEDLEDFFQRDLNAPRLDLPISREFDYVVIADVIEHVQNRQSLLRNARRFLREDGRLIISTGNVAIWFYRLSLLAGRFEYGPRGILDETHVHLYTGASFRREVERAGFEVVESRVTALPFEVVFESTGRSRFMRGIADLYHALARFWPSMFAYQLILEAQITTLDEESVR